MTGKVLVVDDISTNRVILRAKLSASYFDVIQAEGGQEAIDKARKFQPDLILLDVLMPGLDGYETCRRLKADAQTAHIPVIMVTALFAPDDRLKGLECGADDFISKPVNDLALFARLRNLLRSKFMLDELRLRDRTAREFGLGEPAAPFTHTALKKRHIILVPKDRKSSQNWDQAISERCNLTSQTAASEAHALALAAKEVPDIFVIHSQPGVRGDGLRLVSQLRARPETRHAAIILVVPKGDQAIAAKGLDLGASDTLFDPFDPLELAVRLNSQIRRKQISDRLRANVTDTLRLAVLDPLTGLYNRRYARQHIAKIAERARLTGKGFVLMLLDIDNFKGVNDSFGHATGDMVLKEFSRRIQENLRGVDLVARLGGEEFLVAMPDTTKEQARQASERLRQIIEQAEFSGETEQTRLRITVSIGVTLGDLNATDVDTLIGQADRALYASKTDGRNMVTLFNSAA